ncbi:hypothetical protein GCM10010437_051600 [Actinoplanes palleronii]
MLFRVIQRVAWRFGFDKIKNPSPTPELPTAERVKVQSTVGVTEAEPDEPTEPARDWWGEAREVGGHWYRVFRTSDRKLPEAHEEPEGDSEIDLPLDDDEPEPEAVEERQETLEEYIARARRIGAPYNRIVAVAVDHYGISESTAKRRIRIYDESRKDSR